MIVAAATNCVSTVFAIWENMKEADGYPKRSDENEVIDITQCSTTWMI